MTLAVLDPISVFATIDGELEGVVIADPEIIKRRAEFLGLPVIIEDADHYNPNRTQGVIYIDPGGRTDPTNEPGVSDPINAGYCLLSIEHALTGIQQQTASVRW